MFGIGPLELAALLGAVVCLVGLIVTLALVLPRMLGGNPNLTSCPDCGRLVSKLATACPHCGHPRSAKPT